ncbi:hypothetical protein [Xanthomonas theicola]|uniref:hypothetical protein n=1 Tax=Xanthomonas theicola TaxID=56464 RepID=UPI000FF883C1|nr:hypothetical protein [Xanthomonas theicola]QNH24016.1 hypothetical protein G4Q83_03520 [Xanthomonas theicola]
MNALVRMEWSQCLGGGPTAAPERAIANAAPRRMAAPQRRGRSALPSCMRRAAAMGVGDVCGARPGQVPVYRLQKEHPA